MTRDACRARIRSIGTPAAGHGLRWLAGSCNCAVHLGSRGVQQHPADRLGRPTVARCEAAPHRSEFDAEAVRAAAFSINGRTRGALRERGWKGPGRLPGGIRLGSDGLLRGVLGLSRPCRQGARWSTSRPSRSCPRAARHALAAVRQLTLPAVWHGVGLAQQRHRGTSTITGVRAAMTTAGRPHAFGRAHEVQAACPGRDSVQLDRPIPNPRCFLPTPGPCAGRAHWTECLMKKNAALRLVDTRTLDRQQYWNCTYDRAASVALRCRRRRNGLCPLQRASWNCGWKTGWQDAGRGMHRPAWTTHVTGAPLAGALCGRGLSRSRPTARSRSGQRGLAAPHLPYMLANIDRDGRAAAGCPDHGAQNRRRMGGSKLWRDGVP